MQTKLLPQLRSEDERMCGMKLEEISFLDAISVIRMHGLEWEAIQMLHDLVRSDYQVTISKNSEMSACLQMIKKLNNGKNEAIDALCEKKKERRNENNL